MLQTQPKRYLVEAIFELRWKLNQLSTGLNLDPHYKIAIGRIYDKIKKNYPVFEALPTSNMPDEMAGYVVQYRFKKGKDTWPLVQLGPGILTLNDTKSYESWQLFKKGIPTVLNAAYKSYPDGTLNVNNLALRYLNANNFDYANTSVFDFLTEKMQIDIRVNSDLLQNIQADENPSALDLRVSFPLNRFAGVMHLRFARGSLDTEDVLVWEATVQSSENCVLKSKDDIISWADGAHEHIENWFNKLTENM